MRDNVPTIGRSTKPTTSFTFQEVVDILRPEQKEIITKKPGISFGGNRAGWLLATATFVFALIIYAATMCRTVFWWDSGEFIANASVLGIPHRPGFPLYILLARLIGLPPFGNYAARINFLSVLCAAVAVGLFTYVLHRLITRYFSADRPGFYAVLTAMIGMLLTYSFWIQAVRAEVYTLNALVVALVILLLERADTHWSTAPRYALRAFYGAVFVFGLGLGGHHATLLSIAPAAALLMLLIGGRRIMRPGVLLTSAVLLAVGVSVYLFLPIRALQSPLLNWGWNSGSAADGVSAVMATDSYAYIASATPGLIFKRFFLAGALLADQLGWPLALLAGIGLVWWWVHSHRWGLFLLTVILGNLLVVGILATEFIDWNADLHGYLLPALLAATAGMAAGFWLILKPTFGLLERFVRAPYLLLAARTTLIGIVVLLAITPGILAGPFCNLSHNRLAENLGLETMNGLPWRSVVVMDGMNWSFVLRGLQFGAGVRPDLMIIERSLLTADWYQAQCRRRYPDLCAEVDFPTSGKTPAVLAWAEEIRQNGRPVYWEFTERDVPFSHQFQPAGHVYRLDSPDTALSAEVVLKQEQFERASAFYGATNQMAYDFDAQGMYIRNLYRAGMYYERWGLLYRAQEMYRRALAVRPGETLIQDAEDRVEHIIQAGTRAKQE